MTVDDTQNAALVAHIVSQIEQNVQFLASQSYISQADANAILSKLPEDGVHQQGSRSPSAMTQISNKFSGMMSNVRNAVSPPPQVQQARALWGYNENGSDPNDLPFPAGAIVDIIEETNVDWWKGRYNGREGLVPANYMEKLAPSMPAPHAAAPAAPGGYKPYKPFSAAYHGVDRPPPSGQGVNSVGLQEKGDNEEKKKGFGKYKETLAHSAVGGAGFGAGAAIGGGLVRAIF